MKMSHFVPGKLLFVSICVCSSGTLGALECEAATAKVSKLSFVAHTNTKMFVVKGEAKEGEAQVDYEGRNLKSLLLKVPVASLSTGMSIKDKHMRERIFQLSDESVPDIVFASKQAKCDETDPTKSTQCIVSGDLTLRGVTKPHVLTVQVSPQNKVEGTDKINVTEFGVPEGNLHYTGVKVDPIVEIAFEAEPK